MNRLNAGAVAVAIAVVTLGLLALIVARAQGMLPALALDLTEHLFGIVLAVFVFERMLAWREERRWLAAKNWLYMILLETIDDLLKELLPARVPPMQSPQKKKMNGEIGVYEVTAERVHFGEAVAYSPLRLLLSPDDRDLQSYIRWYIHTVGPPRYVDLARAALSDAREQIRDMFGSSARLMEAEITAMLISFEQAALAAIRHLESARNMREQKLEEEEEGGGGSEELVRQRAQQEADEQLAFVSSIIVESVVDSAIKPKGWLEAQIHDQEERRLSPFRRLRASARAGMGSTRQRP